MEHRDSMLALFRGVFWLMGSGLAALLFAGLATVPLLLWARLGTNLLRPVPDWKRGIVAVIFLGGFLYLFAASLLG